VLRLSGLCGPATGHGHSCVGYMDNLLFNPLNMQWLSHLIDYLHLPIEFEIICIRSGEEYS
jgi:hypothetical protein